MTINMHTPAVSGYNPEAAVKQWLGTAKRRPFYEAPTKTTNKLLVAHEPAHFPDEEIEGDVYFVAEAKRASAPSLNDPLPGHDAMDDEGFEDYIGNNDTHENEVFSRLQAFAESEDWIACGNPSGVAPSYSIFTRHSDSHYNNVIMGAMAL